MRAFCTYLDKAYIARGMAMCRSLARSTTDLHMFVLCLDDSTYDILGSAQLPGVAAIRLSEFEGLDKEFAATKPIRSPTEYIYTCTSCWSWFVMEENRNIDLLTYVDADLYFYGSVEPLFSEMRGSSVAVARHRQARYPPPTWGTFNTGWMSWRRDASGLACLQEYRRQCIEWCYERDEDGKYADQKYLDAWEGRPDFLALSTKGANVARWNLRDHRLSLRDGRVTVDGDDLIFFHFSGVRRLAGHLHSTGVSLRGHRDRSVIARHVVRPFVNELRACGAGLPAECRKRTGALHIRQTARTIAFGLLNGSVVYV